MGNKKTISDADIKEIKKRNDAGEKLKSLTDEFQISRQGYYERLDKLDIKPNAKKRVDKLEVARGKIASGKMNDINDMYDVAALLNIDFQQAHKEIDTSKSIETNIKRMNYLKNNSPLKFKEIVISMILSHYKIGVVELIELLKNRQK